MAVNREPRRFQMGSLRDPSELMQTDRLLALKQTRLSFARLLMDRMMREQWRITIRRGRIDENGVGRLVYEIETPSKLLSFGVFSHAADEDENTDRIIATNWDMWGFLCEGEATPELMDYQYEQLPEVREGRATSDVLILTRANRSSRFFGHVVESLEAGHQPDVEFLSKGGYLMRSSGYYGNGLNGTKEFSAFGSDHPLALPYMAQMLSVYMLRIFSYDLADRMAEARSSSATTLHSDVKRYLGTGNASGIGIVHYVVNHPQLIHAWLRAREVALARAKSIEPTADDVGRFEALLADAKRWFTEDDSETREFFRSKDEIAAGLGRIERKIESETDAQSETDAPMTFSTWGGLCEWTTQHFGTEIQEVLHSLLLDVHPEVCRGLQETLTVAEKSDVVPDMSLETLASILTSEYRWALDIDMSEPGARRYFWYRSVDSEEPRLGIHDEHDYAEYGFPIDIANQIQRLHADLQDTPATDTVAQFLVAHPEHRAIVERVQTVHDLAYAEVRANPLDADFVPLSFISCLKAIWGIQKAHPKSKGWVRGTFFQGAPLPADLESGCESYWLYPTKPERAAVWRDDGCT
ncbi:MAG: hypothetical protein ABEI96_08855 [Haloarculaceae archaeon]